MVPMSTIKQIYDKWDYVRKIDKNWSMWNFWWIIEILCLGYPPLWKSQKIEKWQIICLDECWKYVFMDPFYIGDIIYLAKIVRALLSNKTFFLHFCKKSIIQ